MARLEVGREVGQWTVIEVLEPGGNAEVAVVVDKSQRKGVLKAPRDQRTGHVALERFEREIRVQTELGDVAGVLPLLDSSVLDPSAVNFAWMVTPLATRLDVHLRERGPAEAVAAIAEIASTLAELHARGIAHRDLKPANLFWFDGRACVGDLGLVAVPDTDTIAQDGRIPGAFGFVADEILVCGEVSELGIEDWQAADVFALAKSLWALVADLPFAPQGHIGVGDSASSLARRLLIDGAGDLDLVIDNATLQRAGRWDMATFARELTAWLNRPAAEALPDDVQELLGRLKASMATQFAARDAQGQRESALDEALTAVREEARDIEAALRQVDSEVEIGPYAAGRMKGQTEFAEYMGGPVIEGTRHWGFRLTRAGDGLDRILLVDFCVQITDQGQVLLEGVGMCGHQEVGGAVVRQFGPMDSAMRSVELMSQVRQLVSEARAFLPELLAAMA